MVQELRNFEASKETAASEGRPAAAGSGAVWRTLDAALFDRGWSQRALSVTSGISESTISSWKSHLPSERSLDRVVRALNTDTVATPVDLQELRSLRHREQLQNDRRHPAAKAVAPPARVGAISGDISALVAEIGAGGDPRRTAGKLERLLVNLADSARRGKPLTGESAEVCRLTTRFCATHPDFVRVLLPLRAKLHEQMGAWMSSYDDFVRAAALPGGGYDAVHLLHAGSQLLTLGSLDAAARLLRTVVDQVPLRGGCCPLPLDVEERRGAVLHARLMLAWIDDIRGDFDAATAGLRSLLTVTELSSFGLEAAVRHRLGRAMVTRGERIMSPRLVAQGLGHLRRSKRLGRHSEDPYFQLWTYYGYSVLQSDRLATSTAAARSREEIGGRIDHLPAHLEIVDALESRRAGRLVAALDGLLAGLDTWTRLGYALGAQRTALRAGHVAAQLASSPSDYRRAAGLFTTAHMLSDRLKIRDDGLLAFEYATEASRLAGVDQEALSEECADALGTTFADPELPVERSRSAWSPALPLEVVPRRHRAHPRRREGPPLGP